MVIGKKEFLKLWLEHDELIESLNGKSESWKHLSEELEVNVGLHQGSVLWALFDCHCD